jgi:hypothetical protein
MSETVDKTHELFMAATLSDNHLGYPDQPTSRVRRSGA